MHETGCTSYGMTSKASECISLLVLQGTNEGVCLNGSARMRRGYAGLYEETCPRELLSTGITSSNLNQFIGRVQFRLFTGFSYVFPKMVCARVGVKVLLTPSDEMSMKGRHQCKCNCSNLNTYLVGIQMRPALLHAQWHKYGK
jgi:hypothetical protein